VDLTAELSDPVELLFGAQLGGGTDINRALGYCQGLVRQPHDTILVLISDLLLQRDINHLGFLLFRFNAFSVRLR
jgi:hypothetical protein